MHALSCRTALLLAASVTAYCFTLPATASQIFGPGVAVPLSDLLTDDAAIQVGDKLFDDFVYNPTTGAPDAEDVSVQGFLDDDTGDIGIIFTGAFAAYGNPDLGPSIADAGLLFDVTITDPNYVFHSVTLTATMEVLGSPLAALASIGETAGGKPLSVNTTVADGVVIDQNLTSTAVFDEDLTVLEDVLKDVLLNVGVNADDDDVIAVTSFTQVFKQRLIPEPASVALLLLATAGGVAHRRRVVVA